MHARTHARKDYSKKWPDHRKGGHRVWERWSQGMGEVDTGYGRGGHRIWERWTQGMGEVATVAAFEDSLWKY